MDPALFQPLETNSLKDEFILRMEELILRGDLKAGERLPPERELAARFAVSRPVVHEGLLVLENRGLVKMRPRHGVIVRDYRRSGTLELLLSLLNRSGHELDPGLTSDLERLRIGMERDMARLICEPGRDSSVELEELARINRDMRRAESPGRIAELDFRFHLAMALASGNGVYALLMNTLKPAHMHLLSRFYRDSQVLGRVTAYHDRMIALMKARDLSNLLELIETADSYKGYE